MATRRGNVNGAQRHTDSYLLTRVQFKKAVRSGRLASNVAAWHSLSLHGNRCLIGILVKYLGTLSAENDMKLKAGGLMGTAHTTYSNYNLVMAGHWSPEQAKSVLEMPLNE